MPSRTTAVVISVFWMVMMSLLVRRDLVTQWQLDQQLDLRSIAKSDQLPDPVQWAVLHADTRIGTAQTEWRARASGWCEYRNQVELRQVPMQFPALGLFFSDGLSWRSSFLVSPEGHLDNFDIQVLMGDVTVMSVQGRLVAETMRVKFKSGTLVHEESFAYEPHSFMTSSLSPMNNLPNLSVGQKWNYRVMNPIRHATETVRCEVTHEKVITWRREPTPTYVVEQTYGQLRAHCWVARDGTVLRQEVPFGMSQLVLERE